MTADSPAPADSPKVYALLVSSDPTTIDFLTDALQQLATSTMVCTDVPTALRLLNRRKFEAIVVDLQLGEEAKAVLERTRVSPSNRTTVTFAVVSNKEEMETAFAAGSNFVLERPLAATSIGRTLNAAYGLIIRERRRYFRCPVAISAAIRSGDRVGAVQCEAVNISEGGMAVTTSVPLKPGAQVGVQFTLPGQATEFVAESEICWYDEKGRAGLQFLTLSPQQTSGLQDWLSRKLEEILPDSVTSRFRKTSAC
jgi:CheY-like chemotaxis protein